METSQLFLSFILIISTGFLVAIGIQLFFALREFRKTLKRFNGLLDTTESAASELKYSLAGVFTYFEGFKSLMKTLEVINLLAPLQEYLQKKHRGYTPLQATHKIETKHTNGIHALIDKMKDASDKKTKKFVVRGTK